MDCIQELMGAPLKVRADRGTENGHVAAMQTVLATDGCFIYGTSTANQRIESWWGILRRECGQFWMDIFQEIKDQGFFSGDFLDKALVQFCFSAILQVNHK